MGALGLFVVVDLRFDQPAVWNFYFPRRALIIFIEHTVEFINHVENRLGKWLTVIHCSEIGAIAFDCATEPVHLRLPKLEVVSVASNKLSKLVIDEFDDVTFPPLGCRPQRVLFEEITLLSHFKLSDEHFE